MEKILRTLYVCRNLRLDEVELRGTDEEKEQAKQLIAFFKTVGQRFDPHMTLGQNIGTIFYR